MTAYRSPPSHHLHKERKRLPLWRRIVLGRKARLWFDAMNDDSPGKRVERKLRRLQRSIAGLSLEFKAIREELRRPTDR